VDAVPATDVSGSELQPLLHRRSAAINPPHANRPLFIMTAPPHPESEADRWLRVRKAKV
jgi:hypothetical protein